MRSSTFLPVLAAIGLATGKHTPFHDTMPSGKIRCRKISSLPTMPGGMTGPTIFQHF